MVAGFPPTTQASLGAIAATPPRSAVARGKATLVNFWPSKCEMREKKTGPPKPATHTSLCDVAPMLRSDRVLPVGTGGPGITDQAVPSKCSTSGAVRLLVLISPTANTSLLAMAFTANNSSPPKKCGLVTTLHFVPLKC